MEYEGTRENESSPISNQSLRRNRDADCASGGGQRRTARSVLQASVDCSPRVVAQRLSIQNLIGVPAKTTRAPEAYGPSPIQLIKEKNINPSEFNIESNGIEQTYSNISHYLDERRSDFGDQIERSQDSTDKEYIKDPQERKDYVNQMNRIVAGLQNLYNKLSTAYDNIPTVENGLQKFKGFLAQAIITARYFEKGKYLGGEENQSDKKPFRGDERQYVSADIISKTPEKKTKKNLYVLESSGEKLIEVKFRPSASHSKEFEKKTLNELRGQVEKDYLVSGRVKVWWYGPMPKEIHKWATDIERKKPGITFTTFEISGNWDSPASTDDSDSSSEVVTISSTTVNNDEQSKQGLSTTAHKDDHGPNTESGTKVHEDAKEKNEEK
ncbi:hypothetical protein PV762_25675 [Mitsuaria sp. CC2]|uniref:hypothetical protein n=1 Tax=Mitsuaria sp. CC2 TaxID=3029186 RepID=UPI003B8C16BB